jgi:preprotein translocase subunit SecA
MFFSKKKKGPKVRYIVYLSKVMKYKMLLEHLEKSNDTIELIYFFDQTKDEMEKLLKAKGLTNYSLILDKEVGTTSIGNKMIIDVHPIRSVNQKLIDRFDNTSDLEFWIGLDESIMKMFGQEKLPSLMLKMGMKEDEAIEHKMVSTAIERAQENLESKIESHSDIRASLQAWEANNQSVSE